MTRPLLARLNSDGSLDPTFAPDAAPCCYPVDGLLQPDGKVIMSFYLGLSASPLQRFNTDGSVDRTFSSEAFYALAMQPNGSLLVAGADGALQRLTGTQNLAGFTSPQTVYFDTNNLVAAGEIDPTFTPRPFDLSRQRAFLRSKFAASA